MLYEAARLSFLALFLNDNRMKKFILLFYSIFFFSSLKTFGALSPVSVSIIPPIQIPPADFSVTGIRASLLWGHHRDLYGIDLGVLGNITDQDFMGIGVSGIFNLTSGTTNILGLQLAGITNINKNKVTGVGFQIAGLANINTAASSFSGLQASLGVNYSPFSTIYGAQVGIYNVANVVYGFQIGLVNITESLYGVQIGLANFNRKGLFSFTPILNIGF